MPTENCINCPAAPATVKAVAELKPYPDRLCHIDYTAHPHRCGCLSGDDEAQRRFYEFQRDTKLATAEGEVARLTAERDALQQRLNAVDQRNDELISPFQPRVQPWLMECFGLMIAGDREERNHRFLEEALELVQAYGCSTTEAHKLVDYVYGRDVGEPAQEVGGVMVTLAALCLANDMDMHAAGETELARIWTKVEQIRAKQAAKPQMSPLPGAYPQRTQQ